MQLGEEVYYRQHRRLLCVATLWLKNYRLGQGSRDAFNSDDERRWGHFFDTTATSSKKRQVDDDNEEEDVDINGTSSSDQDDDDDDDDGIMSDDDNSNDGDGRQYMLELLENLDKAKKNIKGSSSGQHYSSQTQKDLEARLDEGDEELLRELKEKEEMERMKERMTLAHKNTSKWARQQLARKGKIHLFLFLKF
jgi:hypothetical protein